MRRAGVVGSPVAHSLSPVLHRAAYQALGLTDWRYDRHEVPAGALAAHVAGLGPEWVGLSVTMPGKEEALALAATADEQAVLTEAANTLVRQQDGWAAHNTDVDGLIAALREAGADRVRRAVVLGAGATARSALVAVRRLRAEEVRLVTRSQPREETLSLADRLGLRVTRSGLDDPVSGWGGPDVVVSTLPPGAGGPVEGAERLAGAVVLDVVYAGWPTPWASHLVAAGVDVVGGERMLLHQAAEQVRLMTGRPAPLEAMREALARHGRTGR